MVILYWNRIEYIFNTLIVLPGQAHYCTNLLGGMGSSKRSRHGMELKFGTKLGVTNTYNILKNLRILISGFTRTRLTRWWSKVKAQVLLLGNHICYHHETVH